MIVNPKARSAFFESYVDVLFLVLSLVQGLAFQDLASKARDIIPFVYSTQSFLNWFLIVLYFVLSLAVLIRIIQTYITVALHYGPGYVKFSDIVIVFLIGIVEAFVFRHLGSVREVGTTGGITALQHQFVPSYFWFSLAVLCGLAALVYARNAYFMKVSDGKISFLSERQMNEEKSLQWVNSMWMAVVVVTSLLACWGTSEKPGWIWVQYSATVVCAGAIILSTAFSLAKTFGITSFYTVDEKIPQSSQSPIPPGTTVQQVTRDNMLHRPADNRDIEFIVKRLLDQYTNLLVGITGLAEHRLDSILFPLVRADSLQSPFSYRHWMIIYSNSGPQVDQREHYRGAGLLSAGHDSAYWKSLAPADRPEEESLFKRVVRLVSPNHTGVLPAFDEKYVIEQVGLQGSLYLKQALLGFFAPELGPAEKRLHLVISDGSAKFDDVCDLLFDALSDREFRVAACESDRRLREVISTGTRFMQEMEHVVTGVVLRKADGSSDELRLVFYKP